MSEGESINKIKNTAKAVKKSTVKKEAKPAVVATPIIPTSPVVVTPVAVAAPVVKAPEAKAPVVKATVKVKAPAAKVTTIVAKVDVGFGNALFLRGTGPGLSWEKGIELTNSGSDEWTWSTNKASEAFQAKVLINDVIWSGDPDTTIPAGEKTVITATF